MSQAKRVDAALVDPRTELEMSVTDEVRPSTGMIPSQQLEEKRKAFVRPEFDYTQKSREQQCIVVTVTSSSSSLTCLLILRC